MEDEDYRMFNFKGYDMKVFRDGRIHGYNVNQKKWLERKFELNKTGYFRIYIKCGNYKKHHFVHNIITLCYLGEKPIGFQTDHINHNNQDNRLENLQYISQIDNARKRIISRLGQPIKGYEKTRSGKYHTYISHYGKTLHLGTYGTEEEARQAYIKGKLKYHNIEL